MPDRPSSSPHILFVDDEPHVLSGLRRLLHAKVGSWQMVFAAGGEEALRLARERVFDAVVSDMRMPGMDGAQLLTAVAAQRPETIRIILSGQCDQEIALRSMGPSHVFLSKPCEPALLIDTLERALNLRRMIFDPSVRRALSGLRALPTIPASYHAISHAMEDSHCSSHHIAELIGRDPAITAALLHVANSAYFAPKREVSSIGQAVQYLGMDMVRAVILSSSVFHSFSADIPDPGIIKTVWEHSLRTAVRARAVMQTLLLKPEPRQEGEAYTTGLLHDIGLLALAAAFPHGDERLKAVEGLCECARIPVERAVFGTNHGVIGGFLMGIWGLPDCVVEAIAYHHDPEFCFQASSPLPLAVCLASVADNLAQAGATSDDIVERAVSMAAVPVERGADPNIGAALVAALAAA